jgi:hypothetical protein
MSLRRSPPAIILTFAVVLAIATLSRAAPDIVGLFHDDAVYVVVAKSIAEGSGYRIISLPTSPLQAKYPFLYSGLLSLIWRLHPSFPENILFFKLLNLPALIAALAATAWLYRRHAGDHAWSGQLIAMALTGMSVMVVGFSRMALTDTLFLAFVVLALVVAGARGPCRPGTLAALSAAAYLTRTAGLALILAICLHMVSRRRYRDTVLFTALALALISPWIVWQGLNQEASASVLLDYYVLYDVRSLGWITLLSDIPRALDILTGNVLYLLDSLDATLLLPTLPPLRFVIYPLIVLGALCRGAESGWLLQIFSASYLALVLAWPWHPGRFLIPLVPIVMLFAVRGLDRADAAVRRALQGRYQPIMRGAVFAPFVVFMAVQVSWFSLYLGRRVDAPFATMESQWGGFVETFRWVQDHTEPDAVLGTAFDSMYYLYTGRQAIRPWLYKPETYFYPRGAEVAAVGAPADIKPELTKLKVTHLIVDPMEGYAESRAATGLIEGLLDSYPSRPQPVFVSSDGLHRVYRLPPAARADTPSADAGEREEVSWRSGSR